MLGLSDVVPASSRTAELGIRHGGSGAEETRTVSLVAYAGSRVPLEYAPALVIVAFALVVFFLLLLPGPAALVALGGCGSASAPSAPTGVDGLVVPTPDPRPSDFVDVVDNPWFPLLPGSRWEYDVAGATDRMLVLEVEPGGDIAGVSTTALVRTSADGTVVRTGAWPGPHDVPGGEVA